MNWLMAAIDGDGDLVVLLCPTDQPYQQEWWALWRDSGGAIRMGVASMGSLEVLPVRTLAPASPVEFLEMAEAWQRSERPESIKASMASAGIVRPRNRPPADPSSGKRR